MWKNEISNEHKIIVLLISPCSLVFQRQLVCHAAEYHRARTLHHNSEIDSSFWLRTHFRKPMCFGDLSQHVEKRNKICPRNRSSTRILSYVELKSSC